MFNILALLLLLGEAAHAFLLMGGTGHPQGREPKPLNISIVPQPCVKNCTDFIAYTNVCGNPPNSTDATCGCSPGTQSDIVKCYNCEIFLYSALVQTGQNLLDTYIDECNDAGANVPIATVSGGKSQATSIPHNDTDTSVSSQAPPIPTTTAPPQLPTGTAADPNGGFSQKGDGVMSTTPQTLFGVVLCAITLSLSSLLL